MIITDKLNLQLDPETRTEFAKYLAAGILEHLAPKRALREPVQTPAMSEANAMPQFGELWPGQGGHYVGILPAIGDRPAMHMIAGVEKDRLAWGPYDNETSATSRHDGRANTNALLAAGGNKYPAAAWCADHQVGLLDDFHLPSQAELFLASLYAPQLFHKTSWYWSSTQYSRTTAFAQYFEYGLSGWIGKGNELRVRAFRWIPLTT